MAELKTIKVWVADDGKEYSTELEALRAEAKFWKDKCKIYEGSRPPRQSSYGSSGGGGHD